MKCELDRQKCIACGLCQIYAPNFFDYNDEGLVMFKEEDFALLEKEIPNNQKEQVITSMKKCPTHALISHQ